ncbi:MAG: hypothetical protein AAB407_01425 [Patescibacteria group bacterium]
MNSIIFYIIFYLVGTSICFYAWSKKQGKDFFWLGWVGIGFIILNVTKYILRTFSNFSAGYELPIYLISSILLLITFFFIIRIFLEYLKK